MRTILLAPALFSSEGGIERMMRLYLKALCLNAGPGDNVTLVVLNDSKVPSERLATYSGGHEVTVIAGNRQRLALSARFLWASLRADRIIAGHFHLLLLLDLAKRLRPSLRTYVVAHGTEIWRPWTRREQRIARNGVQFFAVSNYTRARILSRCPGLPELQVKVVPNALDSALAVQPPSNLQRESKRILTVSRLSSYDNYKGVDHLIQAMPLIRQAHPTAHLRIVGKGDDRPRLQALAERLAPDAITFAGFVPDADIPGEYAQADLFALPSRDEGFGLVYLEAFTQGTPCIAASAGAGPELVTPATGRCAIYGDVENLALVCIDALNKNWSHESILERALEFSFEVFCQKLDHNLSF